jgi:2-iminobutanoate/2-iminopropanoate deaminase
VGPYSQAIAVGDWILVSGQIGLDPATGALVPGGTSAEARQALKNLAAILEAAGASLEAVVKTTVYLVDLDDFAGVNEVYAEYFREPYPARATVGVSALPRGARVEIEAIAFAK